MLSLLAQVLPQSSAKIPPLPSPPILESLLFERPLPVAALLAGGAVLAWVMLNHRGRPRPGAIVAGVLLLLCAACVAVAVYVQTEREKMTRATYNLVAAAAKGDNATLNQMLAPDVRLFNRYKVAGCGPQDHCCGRDWILANDPKVMQQYQVSEPSIRECQAVSTGNGVGATQVLVRIQAMPAGDIPITHRSWWRVDWRRDTDGNWVVTALEPLDIPFAPMAEEVSPWGR